LIRDQVATIAVPESIREMGSYCVKVETIGASGSWKTGWSFEGFSITKKD